MQNENAIELAAREVLKALADRKNVILTGPPGTGKSRLLNQIREIFEWRNGDLGGSLDGAIPIPPETSPPPAWFPSPTQTLDRKAFPTVFDQNTKYRDVMRGLVPAVDEVGRFIVSSGTVYRAAEHARVPGQAALVIIDEINRGPAVAAFGSALVGLEPDKRLPTNGVPNQQTQYFEILGDKGQAQTYALPEDLYIIASMNEADTSVEPLDVAFLRRFHTHRLEPQITVLRRHLGLQATPDSTRLPATPSMGTDWYEALARAFEVINDQMLLGRGQAYQLGHGALMHKAAPAPTAPLTAVEEYVTAAWGTFRAHIDEVFYGNTRALADVLRAEASTSPYTLEERTFAGQNVRRVLGPTRPSPADLYRLLALIATP